MDQARRMVKMRVKFDVWSQGLDEGFRDKIRNNLRDLFCQLPVRRVWLYLKYIRGMILGDFGPWDGVMQESNVMFDGPEDTIARGSAFFHYIFARCGSTNACHCSESIDS